MERVVPYLKAAALVSAIVLGGAFVAYRAGAFAAPVPVDTRANQEPPVVPLTPVESPAPTDPPHTAIMLGSKSAPAFAPSAPGSLAPNNTIVPLPGLVLSPALMGGSKSFQVFPATPPPASVPPVAPQP